MIELNSKREELRQRIRKQEQQTRQKKRIQENMIMLKVYMEQSKETQQEKLNRVFEAIPIQARPSWPYKIQDIITKFEILVKQIEQPSQNQTCLNIISLLWNICMAQPESFTPQIIEYVNQFIMSHPYQNLKSFPEFRRQFLRLLEHTTDIKEGYQENWESISQSLETLKESAIKWSRGTDAIRVLTNSFTKCLNVVEYSHVYQIIDNMLGSNQEQSRLAVLAVLSLGENSDQDDIRDIHEQYPSIYEKLIKCSADFNSPSHQLFVEAIRKMLDTYNSVIVTLTSGKLLQLIKETLQQNNASLYVRILEMLNHIVYCKKEKMGRILKDESNLQLWVRVASLHRFAQNRKVVILVYSIFSGFFNFYEQSVLLAVLAAIQESQNSVFDLLETCFRNYREDDELLLRTMEIARTLLFYTRNGGFGTVVLKQIVRRNYVPIIYDIYLDNREGTSKLAGEILEVVEYSGVEEEKDV